VFLKGSAQAALLFDEVEDVFPPISSEAAQLMARAEQVAAPASHSVSGKAWVNQILETNPVPTLWVTNRIEQIDPAFAAALPTTWSSRSRRPVPARQLVRKTLEGVAVSDGFVAKLTERKGLTPAQIRTAVRFAALARRPGRRRASARPGCGGGADRAAAAQCRPGSGQQGRRCRRAAQRDHL
jgi:hypothetical protein